MIVESKYNIDDFVWKIHMNKVYKYTISGVFIDVYNDGVNITYSLIGCDDKNVCENDLFSSKEELLKSL